MVDSRERFPIEVPPMEPHIRKRRTATPRTEPEDVPTAKIEAGKFLVSFE